jgi:hypothetical protein
MNLLPDDVLLDIFGFCVNCCSSCLDSWRTLIHVCQRWRNIVLASPHRLNLRLLCTQGRPVRRMLDIWPAFPIVIWGIPTLGMREDNIIAALEHTDRVCEITFLDASSQALKSLSAAMHGPFPELTILELQLDDRQMSFPEPLLLLDGGCPRLRSLELYGIPFSAVQKLLESASDLVHLSLCHLPVYEYVSPEEIATCLSSMTKLESMALELRHPRYYPRSEGERPSPLPRTVLPALTRFGF